MDYRLTGPAMMIDPGNSGTTVIHVGEKFLPLYEHYRHKALFGGRGSAKSHTIATAITVIASKSTKRIVCGRQYQNSIRDSSKSLIENKIRALGLSNQFRILEREIVHVEQDSRFTFIGLEKNPDSIKSLEGADIFWGEEAGNISSTSLETIIPTIRKEGSELWWSWNPDKRDDPIDYYFRGPVVPDNSFICRVGIEDNPYFLQTEMPAEAAHMREGNFKRYLHIWQGEYDENFEGRIFSNTHIERIQVPDHIAPRYGMDFGFGNDPSALIKLYVNEEKKSIYIAREFFGRLPLRELPEAMDTVLDDRSDYIKADSSQPQTIDHLNSCGFNLDGAKKGPGSVKSGINWLLGYKIYIDPDCENMHKEAALYSWQQDRLTKKILNHPVDAHNHGWDAIRYATEDAQTIPYENNNGVVKINFGWKARR